MDLDEQPFDLRESIENALEIVRIKAVEKDLELACEIQNEVPSAIIGDPNRVSQVLINLLSNAIKFTETGEVSLLVSRGQAARPVNGNVEIQFSVRDTGIGIAADQVEKLFQPFTQADITIARKYGGTGLGLAISTRLVQMMGGKIWVESQPGEGSTFHFTIYVPTAPDMRDYRQLRTDKPQLKGKRVLIVDDNQTNRRLLAHQLRNWGLLVRDAAEPLRALEWLRQGDPFDLAMLDMSMPEMNGLELAGQIRGLAGCEKLPLILCSSLGLPEKDLPAGLFIAYLTKPIRPSQLLDTLLGIFNGHGLKARWEDEKLPEPPPELNLGASHPLRILVAEDNLVNQKLLTRMLAQIGYSAEVANNGLEVLKAAEQKVFDVILMDVQMPEMDGLQATRQLHAQKPAGKRPYIIAVTANAMHDDRQTCLNAGMDDYISKPIRMEELRKALAQAPTLTG